MEVVTEQATIASFPLMVSARAPTPDVEALRKLVAAELTRVGAILLRGFAMPSLSAFEGLVSALTPNLLDYEFGSTPRSQLDGRIYTSTEYPAHQWIPLHNEQSYTREWPRKIWFHCVTASHEGGATPLADSRRVYQRLAPVLRARFERKRVMYVRNYGNGLDLPWQRVFATEDPADVEAYCRRADITCEWKHDGELRTRQICQASARHPETDELVWFNQAHLFHVSNLEPSVREGLLSFLEEDELPRNVFYGDGSPLEADALAEIRAAYDAEMTQFPWQRGDVLLLDNMLIAHGRAPFAGARKVVVAMAEPYRER
ncbi:MAG TPA: TauD/TfdA family dioxygenase [Polyangiales bacterium]|nr:TauD/TfdA family dioxygenase [Polyangiales bacterium]